MAMKSVYLVIIMEDEPNKSFNLSRLLSRLCACAQIAPMIASQVKLMLGWSSGQDVKIALKDREENS